VDKLNEQSLLQQKVGNFLLEYTGIRTILKICGIFFSILQDLDEAKRSEASLLPNFVGVKRI